MAMVVGGVVALLATLALVYYGYGYTGTNIDNLQYDETRLLLLEDPKTTIDKDIPTKCTNGPYVYNPWKRNEGIGAQIQKRKYSLILAAAVEAKWVGKLENDHNDNENRHFNYASLLGFPTDEDCTVSDIENEETAKHLSFSTIIDMSRFDIHDMCQSISDNKIYDLKGVLRKNRVLGPNSVLVVAGRNDGARFCNHCLWNPQLRERFRLGQRQRYVVCFSRCYYIYVVSLVNQLTTSFANSRLISLSLPGKHG